MKAGIGGWEDSANPGAAHAFPKPSGKPCLSGGLAPATLPGWGTAETGQRAEQHGKSCRSRWRSQGRCPSRRRRPQRVAQPRFPKACTSPRRIFPRAKKIRAGHRRSMTSRAAAAFVMRATPARRARRFQGAEEILRDRAGCRWSSGGEHRRHADRGLSPARRREICDISWYATRRLPDDGAKPDPGRRDHAGRDAEIQP